MSRHALLLLAVGALACTDGNDPAAVATDAGSESSPDTGGVGSGGSSQNPDANGGAAGSSGSAGSADSGPSCSLANVTNIAVAAIDLEGYPPYAVDACKLAYVSATSGALLLRDLATGSDVEMAPASEAPRRPTLAGDVLAWQSGDGVGSQVRVSFGGQVRTATGAFVRAGEPRATVDAVVFTGWLTDTDSDVFQVRAAGPAQVVLGGSGQQRFADISPTHVAVSDFSEDPSGVYSGDGTSLSDLVLIERATGAVRRRTAAGKQAFPLLGVQNRMVFLEWVGVHPVPKFQEYALRALDLNALDAEPLTIDQVTSDRPTVRPVARGEFVEWVERPVDRMALFFRAKLESAATPVAITGLEGLELFAPAASDTITVIAVRAATGGPTLRAIER